MGPEPTGCQNLECGEPATKIVSYPSIVRGLGLFRLPYCDTHAAEILAAPWMWPDAKVERELGSFSGGLVPAPQDREPAT